MTVKEHVHKTYTYTCDLCQQRVDKSADLTPLLIHGEVGVCASCMDTPLRDAVAALGLHSAGIPSISPPSQDNRQRDPAAARTARTSRRGLPEQRRP